MNTDPLAQLHDIHLPAEPGWWPPAPGWWLLLVLLLAATAALCVRAWRRHRRNAWRRAAFAELDALATRAEPEALARELNRLLRRVARQIEGPQAAALSGEDWANFLQSRAPATLPETLWENLALAPYRPPAAADTNAWLHGCRRWIAHV